MVCEWSDILSSMRRVKSIDCFFCVALIVSTCAHDLYATHAHTYTQTQIYYYFIYLNAYCEMSWIRKDQWHVFCLMSRYSYIAGRPSTKYL